MNTYYERNKETLLANGRKYRAENPQWKTNRTNKRYNIDLEMWLLSQGNACAICSEQFTEDVSPHVDHDHSCCETQLASCGECVRGLLCSVCNLLISRANDDPGRFQYVFEGAASYLNALKEASNGKR
jgi:hypothetical protein